MVLCPVPDHTWRLSSHFGGSALIRLAPFAIELVLLVLCLVDLAQSPDHEIRNLPKWAWLLLILFLPLVGSIAWLVAGRPVHVRQTSGTWGYGNGFPEATRPSSDTSDIDRRLEADLARADREHEEMLRRWEADLERRERDTRPDDDHA
jgi:hypothetical protein